VNKQTCNPAGEECQSGSIGEIFQRIDLVAKKLKQIQRQTIKETNLTPTQYFILTLLWKKDERPFKELASACYCSRATITGIVDTLEKNEIVTREPNPNDRRSLLAKLTEKGKALKQSTPTLERTFGSCCAGLEPDEFRQLDELLRKLDASLDCSARS